MNRCPDCPGELTAACISRLHDAGYGQQTIARKHGVGKTTMARFMQAHGIKARTQSEAGFVRGQRQDLKENLRKRFTVYQVSKFKLETLYKKGFTIAQIAIVLRVPAGVIQHRMVILGIERRPPAHLAPGNFKSDNKVTYGTFHMRVRKQRGTPQKCEVCGRTDPEATYDWANLTGNYVDVNDYKRMCRSCHLLYDLYDNPTGLRALPKPRTERNSKGQFV